MITLRKSKEREHVLVGGHETWLTFDADSPTDPLSAGFRTLEGLNEVILAPGASFLFKSHKDIEVFTYIREGTLTLESLQGTTIVLGPGECSRWGIRSGTTHRASNRSFNEPVHAFQCFVTTDRSDSKSRAQQKRFLVAERQGLLRLMGSPDGKRGSLRMHQDILIYSALLDTGHHVIHELVARRGAWLHVVKGRIQLLDCRLATGDGASFVDEAAVSWTAQERSEILLFDVAAGKRGEAARSAAKQMWPALCAAVI